MSVVPTLVLFSSSFRVMGEMFFEEPCVVFVVPFFWVVKKCGGTEKEYIYRGELFRYSLGR
jgi:hypothetical protein